MIVKACLAPALTLCAPLGLIETLLPEGVTRKEVEVCVEVEVDAELPVEVSPLPGALQAIKKNDKANSE